MKSLFCAALVFVSGGLPALVSAQTVAPAPPASPPAAVRPRRSISGDQNTAALPAPASAPVRPSVFQNIPNPNDGVDVAFAGSDVQAVLAWLQRNTGKVFLISQALSPVRISYSTQANQPAPGANGNAPSAPALLKRAQVVFALEGLLYGDGVGMVALDADTVAVIPADSPLKRAVSTGFMPSADTLVATSPGSPNHLSVFKNIPSPDVLTSLAYSGANLADAKTVFAWLQDNTGYSIIAAQNLPPVQLSFTTDAGQPVVGPSGLSWPGLKRGQVVLDLERLLFINGIALLPSDGKTILAVPVQLSAQTVVPPSAAVPAPIPSGPAPAAQNRGAAGTRTPPAYPPAPTPAPTI